jgi:hypothetical protein
LCSTQPRRPCQKNREVTQPRDVRGGNYLDIYRASGFFKGVLSTARTA